MKIAILNYVEKAINLYLRQDSLSHERLAKMAGKCICVELMPLQLVFFCRFTQDGMVLTTHEEIQHIAKLKGTPLQFGAALIDKKNRKQFFADDLHIEGDAEFAQEVTDLFDHVSIDWEEHAAQFLGDIPAYHLSKFTRGVYNFIKQSGNSLTKDISDYVHEEAAWFPVREELQTFFNDIDTLRMDADRLEARIAHLTSIQEEEDTP